MKDFNLHKFLRDNPLIKQKKTLSKGKINEAFEGFGGVRDASVIGDGVPKQSKDFGWDPTDTADYDEKSQPNTWIADIDRTQPSYGDWKATWEHPGLIVWSHADVPDAVVVATPGWDGEGTPIEFQSDKGSSQMLKVLDQDVFPTFKDYLNAIKPYLDMVLDANSEATAGTMSGNFEDMGVDMLKKGIREIGINTRRVDYLNPMEDEDDEMPSRIEGLVDQRQLAKFAEAVMAIAQDLDDEGFDSIDIKKLLRDKLDDMIIG
jgi:hypothetical protein